MILEVFATRDLKLSVFSRPFFEINAIQAQRGLQVAVNDPNTQLYHYPEDFELMHLGSFDDVTGRFNLFDNPKFIVAALPLKKKPEIVPSFLPKGE